MTILMITIRDYDIDIENTNNESNEAREKQETSARNNLELGKKIA